jgi:hypothetical protein
MFTFIRDHHPGDPTFDLGFDIALLAYAEAHPNLTPEFVR